LQKKRTIRVRASIINIQKAGKDLRLPQIVIATAATFFHRFFAHHPLHEFDRLVMAMACLFLASKVEEVPKKVRDIILATYYASRKETLHADSPEFTRLREQVIRYEQLLVSNISLAVDHPYQHLVTLAKAVDANNKELVQIAWNFINDSLRTEVCLHYAPQLISGAALYLSARCIGCLNSIEKGTRTLFDVINMSKSLIEEVSNQIMDLYETAPSLASMSGERSVSPSSLKTEKNTAEKGETPMTKDKK